MIQIVAAFAAVGVIGGLIVWWAIRELAEGVKHV